MKKHPPIIITLAQTDNDLKGIKALQTANLKDTIAPENRKNTGFVTASYPLALLQKMHGFYPPIIAKRDQKVVGYALVVDRQIIGQHELLDDLFRQIDTVHYQKQPLAKSNYIVVGQLCVAQEVRGQGVAQKLYNHFRTVYSSAFDYCITDVDQENLPSLRAHQKTGFQVLDTISYGGSQWSVVLWDW